MGRRKIQRGFMDYLIRFGERGGKFVERTSRQTGKKYREYIKKNVPK